MLVLVHAGNQNVVQMGIAAGETMKDLVNEPLEGLGSILQTKRHAGELKQSERHDYGCFGEVRGLHRDVRVCSQEVNLAENGSPSQ